MESLKKIGNYLITPVYAGEISLTPDEDPWKRLAGIKVENIVPAIIKLILVATSLVAFFFLLWGGFKWITSGGDKEQTAKAQGVITAALIGLAVVFASWAIINLLGTFFGIQTITSLQIPQIK